VVGAIVQGVDSPVTGIFNVAGDGKLTSSRSRNGWASAAWCCPPGLLQSALWLLKKLGLTQYGPEQIDFLRYRPVLDNTAAEGRVRLRAEADLGRGVRALYRNSPARAKADGPARLFTARSS
jgi:hypothetical protein